MSRFRLSSLLLVEERLLEAKYFARRLRQLKSSQFSYELNAFLSAARSVTFLLQKEMAHVPGFVVWWDSQRQRLAADPAAQFFLKLRNFSQKEGRINAIGTRTGRCWSYRFAGNAHPVPPQLLQRDVSECCHEHVSKLATLILTCTDAFPYHACPRRALTPEGIHALQISIEDIEELLGFPRGWTEPISDPTSRIFILREHVDGLDLDSIRRLARWKPKRTPPDESSSAIFGDRLTASLVLALENRRGK